MSIGIYKITNKENGSIYIGQSIHIEQRFLEHKRKAFNLNSSEYDTALYKAFRKYGLDNFTFEIIDICNVDELNDKEMFWISYFNSYKHGYNCTIGGNSRDYAIGEKHSNHKLTEQDVIDIRSRYNNLERKNDVYDDYRYQINFSGFSKIWQGETWKNIMMDVYTKENIQYHKSHTGNPGSKNGRAKITEAQVIKIREQKKNGVNVQEAYASYSNLFSFRYFQQIWYNQTWKNIS